MNAEKAREIVILKKRLDYAKAYSRITDTIQERAQLGLYSATVTYRLIDEVKKTLEFNGFLISEKKNIYYGVDTEISWKP